MKNETLYPHNGYVEWKKGKKILQLVDTYVVVDIETTGLETFYDEIIELSAIKIADNKIIDKYTTLCKPRREIDSFITQLTGITNKMLNSAPPIKDVIRDYVEFIGNSIVVGHNINFDINFIYYNFYNICKEHFINNYIDTLRLARIALPHLEHHRLEDVVEYFKLGPFNLHRSLDDCNATFDIYSRLKRIILENDISLKTKKSKTSKKIDLKNITATTDDFDTSHPLYNKYCVFTGKLDKMLREDAARIVANLGGINENNMPDSTGKCNTPGFGKNLSRCPET